METLKLEGKFVEDFVRKGRFIERLIADRWKEPYLYGHLKSLGS